MFVRSDLSIKFPYNIEEEYSTEELESRDLHEKYDSEREEDAEYCGSCNSPKYSFFPHLGREIFRCHTDEDGIITTHHEVDEDDI